MINIFNLFLFLFALWILFMFSSGNVSVLYVFFGILCCSSVAVASSRLKLIEEKSELLYLSFGFYRHFFKIFTGNFFSAIKLVASLAFGSKQVHPVICKISLKAKYEFNPALLLATINMTSGLLCIGLKNEDHEFLIHAIDEKYFDKFDLQKVCASLDEVNDDNLV